VLIMGELFDMVSSKLFPNQEALTMSFFACTP
jgi:hypothetical protein